MTLDIRGGLKNTSINKNHYVFIDELLSNAIDSYLIRSNDETDGLQVCFSVDFFSTTLDESTFDIKVTCTDNGAGFGQEQIKAFVTKDTTYKDDLTIAGIGKCKGSGRIQFFHYFSKISIDSISQNGDGLSRYVLDINDPNIREISEDSFFQQGEAPDKLETSFTLDSIKPEIYEKLFGTLNIKEEFSANTLKNHVLVSFLRRFISLKNQLGNFQINFISRYKEDLEEAILTPTDLPDITSKKDVEIHYNNSGSVDKSKKRKFSLSHYKLPKQDFSLKSNYVALCAKSSSVKVITKRYLKTKTLENNDIEGFYHIVLIESDYLDECVNEQRDDFNIPTDSQSDLYLNNLISFETIYNEIDNIIEGMLVPPDWNREIIVKNVTEKYGVSSNMISEANVRVHYGDTEESVVKRVLSAYQEKIIQDTSDIFDIRKEISESNPNDERFREKVNNLAWKYTSSLKNIDMANLSQLVVRRAAIIEILNLAIKQQLSVQTDNDGRKCDEKIIHNIFFPMGKDSRETGDHDIWLLSEEYQYFDYIASDKKLSSISWGNEGNALFEDNIDADLQAILKKNYEDNDAKRPDIAIFGKEGSAIIIEFKAPGVSMDNHIGDLMEYAQLLTAKSQGKLKKVYGYLIGTELNPNRLTGYKHFPSEKGWFNTEEIRDHKSGNRLGELYSEILYYPDIVSKAEQRLNVYKEKLNINLGTYENLEE